MLSAVFGIIGVILGTVSLVLSIYALVEVLSFKKSTHRIQYLPLDPNVNTDQDGFQKLTEEQLEEIEKEDIDFMDFKL